MLARSDGPLETCYDLVMLDLDGVVYVGPDAVPGAADHLARVRAAGTRCAFVTNNASRPPEAVAEHLRDLGVEAATEDVVTSAQAAAGVLRERHGEGARVLVLGAAGLWQAVREAGLEGVEVPDGAVPEVAALVTGYGPDIAWRHVMRAAVLVRDGLPWVASNTDLTIPTPYGAAPGHGVLVEMLRRFGGRDPVVAGKPERPLLAETITRVGGQRPLMVGDRVDTDIEGGINAGVDTLLVMTGVTGVSELVEVPEGSRPTFLAADLAGLSEAHEPPQRDGAGQWSAGGWTATVEDGRLAVTGQGSATHWWQALACAAWSHLDEHGRPAGSDGLDAPPPPGG